MGEDGLEMLGSYGLKYSISREVLLVDSYIDSRYISKIKKRLRKKLIKKVTSNSDKLSFQQMTKLKNKLGLGRGM
jgi:hypothetical protein